MQVNRATISLLSSILEIFATARSALATYAIAMSVTGGDQTFSIFTTAVVEGALVLSMMGIGFDPVSPLTAVAALVFSAVMQYVEIVTLTGQLSSDQKQTLVLALAFAPTVLLALGILRRVSEGSDVSALDWLLNLFKRGDSADPKKTRATAFDVPAVKGKRKSKHPFQPGSSRGK